MYRFIRSDEASLSYRDDQSRRIFNAYIRLKIFSITDPIDGMRDPLPVSNDKSTSLSQQSMVTQIENWECEDLTYTPRYRRGVGSRPGSDDKTDNARNIVRPIIGAIKIV